MMKQVIGENSGLIWNLLNREGEVELSYLLKISKLNEADFNMALGWLAREGKVSFFSKELKQMVFLVY